MTDTTDDASDRLIRSDELAARLRVSKQRLRMIPASELPYVQLESRGRRAYAEGDVAAYLERRTVRR